MEFETFQLGLPRPIENSCPCCAGPEHIQMNDLRKTWRKSDTSKRMQMLAYFEDSTIPPSLRPGNVSNEGIIADRLDRVLHFLWDIAREEYESITVEMLNEVLQCHANLISNASTVDRIGITVRLAWLEKCIEEVRRNVFVLPALNQFLKLCLQCKEKSDSAGSSIKGSARLKYR